MILHYLGLDHIGHIAGPFSPLVPTKLSEMDEVIQQIHLKLKERDERDNTSSLLVICGDHGMSDQGGHGGSSTTETLTPLILLGKHLNKPYHKGDVLQEVNQIDLTSTLSLLLGLPIPYNNIGTIITQVFTGYQPKELLQIFYINTHQMYSVYRTNKRNINHFQIKFDINRAEDIHRAWLMRSLAINSDDIHYTKVQKFYENVMKRMRDELVDSLAKYDVQALYTGTAIILLVLLTVIMRYLTPETELLPDNLMSYLVVGTLLVTLVTTHITVCTSDDNSEMLCSMLPSLGLIVIITSLLVLLISSVTQGQIRVVLPRKRVLDWFLVLGTVIHSFTLLSSSFVEEEHQTWYFFICTVFILLIRPLAKHNPIFAKSLVTIMILSRVLRFWNQTGIKWAHRPDIGDWLVRSESKVTLSLCVLVAIVMAVKVLQYHILGLGQKLLILLAGIAVYCHRAARGDVYLPGIYTEIGWGIWEARLVMIVILVLLMTGYNKPITKLHTAFGLVGLLLLRSHNMIPWTIILIQEKWLSLAVIPSLKLNPAITTLLYLWMGQASFFYLGNSNSLSTIDVSAGYIGLVDYNPIVIGILMGLSTYIGPIYWITGAVRIYTSTFTAMKSDWSVTAICYIIIISRSLLLFTYTSLTTLLRFHLFVWTVFSPKLLYEAMFTLVTTIIIIIIFAIFRIQK